MDVKGLITDPVLVQKRRRQIVAAAIELFAQRGYYRTTIQDVARKAGVSIGLIYQYVEDKDGVLLLVLLDVLEAYKREIPAALEGVTDPLRRCETALAAYCRVVDSLREATVLTYRSTKSLPRERIELIKTAELETNRLIADCIHEAMAAGLFRPIDLDLVTYQFVMFAHAWALKYWRLRQSYTLEGYIAFGQEFLMNALLTEAGWQHYHALKGP